MEIFAYILALIWSDASRVGYFSAASSRVGHQGKDSQTGM